MNICTQTDNQIQLSDTIFIYLFFSLTIMKWNAQNCGILCGIWMIHPCCLQKSMDLDMPCCLPISVCCCGGSVFQLSDTASYQSKVTEETGTKYRKLTQEMKKETTEQNKLQTISPRAELNCDKDSYVG